MKMNQHAIDRIYDHDASVVGYWGDGEGWLDSEELQKIQFEESDFDDGGLWLTYPESELFLITLQKYVQSITNQDTKAQIEQYIDKLQHRIDKIHS